MAVLTTKDLQKLLTLYSEDEVAQYLYEFNIEIVDVSNS